MSSFPPPRHSLASLVARDIAQVVRPARRARRASTSRSGRAAGSAWSRRTAPARARCLRILAGHRDARLGPRRRARRRPRPSATSRRSPSAARARRCARTSRGAPAWPRPSARSTTRARRSPTAPAGADDAYADALDAYLALGAADLDARIGAVLADLGLPDARPRPRDAGALGRPGGAREPRRDPPRPLRRVPARRAHQRSRLRRARPARALPARRPRRRRRDRVARPRVPRSHRHAACSSSTSTRTRRPSTPAVGPRTSPSGRPPAATPRRTTRPTSRSATTLRDRAREQRQWSVQGVAKVAKSGETDKFIRALPPQQQRARRRQGQDHRQGPRTARGQRGRQAVGELGPPHGDRGRAPGRRGRGAADRARS